ncbi:helix-turn-helix domain-containing protein [Nonomuraea sp. NPDC050383]|uniref:helix-turn-helix domain-containing protein n=1 Tax=Nonomuraea sp. NPDC050383 TaxID=3364362 RepID=UPI0037968766
MRPQTTQTHTGPQQTPSFPIPGSAEPGPLQRPTMTVREAAAVLGIDRGAAYDAVRRGELSALRIGRKILIPPLRSASCSAWPLSTAGSDMSIHLIVEVLDHAPATLTYRELFLLIVFAEQARDATRECWPGVEDDPRFLHRARLSRSQRYAAINSLISKGVLKRVTGGRKYRRATFRNREMAPPDASTSAAEHAGDIDQGERPGDGLDQAPAERRRDVQALLRQAGGALTDQAAHPPHVQRPENRDPDPDQAAAAQRPANRDPEPPPQRPGSRASASGNVGLSVPDGRDPYP